MNKQTDHKTYYTKVSKIWIDDENIMHVVFDKDVTLTLQEMQDAYKIFAHLGLGPGKNKSRQLLSGGPIVINKDARDFAGKSGSDFFIAAAMVTDSFFTRFVINLFNSTQKHSVPFKLFATEEEAITWLRTFSS